ncbi:phospholipase C, phosphocholine-specific [Membranicola marinus]|uniref:phospholipase C n=1 Tax=Membranihabitans marinus TaxID=1227546 RepID=A0A953HVD9_9BACT|nr:phospholipase C, phosphocholine-specific [Membranihabitans marinus]MBY5957241.1 phospholipase C, phosphocholine-specific [Membranihabitans marinus]
MASRRDFIKQAALLSGTTAMAGLLPSSIQRALAINPAKGSTFEDAEHIVILMQENRSFDHAFGKLRGVRGFNDPRAITQPNNNKVWLQSDKNGNTYSPFRLDIKNTKATWMSSLPHSWENMVDARNNGKYDLWLEAKRSGNPDFKHMPLTMGFHDRNDIPFYYALADAFTVCDYNFCSSLTGTTANRHYLWSGTLRDPSYRKSKANVHNHDVTYYNWARWKTFPERLEENGISWRVYQNELSMPCGFEGEEESWLANYTNNNLEWFEQYGVRYAEGFQNYLSRVIEEVPARIEQMEKELSRLTSGSEEYKNLAKTLEETKNHLQQAKSNKQNWNREIFEELSEYEKNIHNNAYQTNIGDPDYHSIETLKYNDDGTDREMKVPKSDILYQFRKDVDEGNLPAVSWVCAPKNFSDHPSAPWYGAWYISEMVDILTKNPEVWKKTIFIINYDENDGYFDHVPPFVPPETGNPETGKISHNSDTWLEFARKEDELERRKNNPSSARWGPVGLGFRVPMLVVSPWSRGGYVNSDVLDHTSTLQLIERVMAKKSKGNLREENISPWRRMICGDMSSAFRPYNGEKIFYPDSVERDKFVATIHQAQYKDLPEGYKNLTESEQKQINENPRESAYMPTQEPGIKDSNALCYHMNVDGQLNKSKRAFELKFEARNFVFGDRTRGVPYIVYAPGSYKKANSDDFEKVRAWNYAVAAGDRLEDSYPLTNFQESGYHLRVYGPNGFYREYMGSENDPELELYCDYEQDARNPLKLTGNLEIIFNNKTGKNISANIVDQAYGQSPLELTLEPGKQSTVIDLSKSHRWYDLKVEVDGYRLFGRHMAGRVENDQDGKTDPQMA